MIQVINPSNGNLIRELVEDSPQRITAKFTRAAAAQPEWAARPLQERVQAIHRVIDLFERKKVDLASITTSETGKPVTQARGEIGALSQRLRFFADNVERTSASEIVWSDPDSGMEEKIIQEPLGVIAHISAWNYPYFVGTNVIVPALLTGNAVMYKPSEKALLTGSAICELFHEAGIPEDILIPVMGGADAGAELLGLQVRGVYFTGSLRTGRKIAAALAGRMLRLQLELGGKDPVYVCDDVDVEKVAPAIADGAFYNTGQSCCSVERIYVHHRIHERFLEAFVAAVRDFRIKDPMDERTYIGPLAREAQLSVLSGQVKDAIGRGGVLLCGGQRMVRPGFYFEPTVIDQANHSMLIMREESFGPVIGIQTVGSDEEALHWMNDSEYGLTAGVYSSDRARAEAILSRVEAGTVYWNCCDRVSPRLPWSGRKNSGIGLTLSLAGIQAFLQPKALHARSLGST